jgi:hypothetical protein
MFAAVPEGAIVELVQAILVQPRVDTENKSQRKSDGMQVTMERTKSTNCWRTNIESI